MTNFVGSRAGSPDTPVRVGVVEVGSRAIRMLVADISGSRGLVRVKNYDDRDAPAMLGNALELGAKTLSTRLAQAQRTINQYLLEARNLGATQVFAFGTEAVRKIEESGLVERRPILENVETLDRDTEALCSFITAIKVLPSEISKGRPILVVDQGAGSTEIIVGTVDRKIRLLESTSLEVGGVALVELFKVSNWKISNFQRRLSASLETVGLPRTRGIHRVIAQGGTAGNAAWLRESRDANDRYHPGRVHGKGMRLDDIYPFLATLDGYSPRDLAKLALRFYPQDKTGVEFAKSLVGLASYALIVQKFEVDQFIVSANGTRDGVAWRLALGADIVSGETAE